MSVISVTGSFALMLLGSPVRLAASTCSCFGRSYWDSQMSQFVQSSGFLLMFAVLYVVASFVISVLILTS